MSLELTRVGLLVELANHYTTTGASYIIVSALVVLSQSLSSVVGHNLCCRRITLYLRLLC